MKINNYIFNLPARRAVLSRFINISVTAVNVNVVCKTTSIVDYSALKSVTHLRFLNRVIKSLICFVPPSTSRSMVVISAIRFLILLLLLPLFIDSRFYSYYRSHRKTVPLPAFLNNFILNFAIPSRIFQKLGGSFQGKTSSDWYLSPAINGILNLSSEQFSTLFEGTPFASIVISSANSDSREFTSFHKQLALALEPFRDFSGSDSNIEFLLDFISDFSTVVHGSFDTHVLPTEYEFVDRLGHYKYRNFDDEKVTYLVSSSGYLSYSSEDKRDLSALFLACFKPSFKHSETKVVVGGRLALPKDLMLDLGSATDSEVFSSFFSQKASISIGADSSSDIDGHEDVDVPRPSQSRGSRSQATNVSNMRVGSSLPTKRSSPASTREYSQQVGSGFLKRSSLSFELIVPFRSYTLVSYRQVE
jgi:hypothetical protein